LIGAFQRKKGTQLGDKMCRLREGERRCCFGIGKKKIWINSKMYVGYALVGRVSQKSMKEPLGL
jgi:hypothetical protein